MLFYNAKANKFIITSNIHDTWYITDGDEVIAKPNYYKIFLKNYKKDLTPWFILIDKHF